MDFLARLNGRAFDIARRLPVYRIGYINKGLPRKSCSICHAIFQKLDVVTYLTCFHRFHTECISRWLTENDQCPDCRSVVRPDVFVTAREAKAYRDVVVAFEPKCAPLHMLGLMYREASAGISRYTRLIASRPIGITRIIDERKAIERMYDGLMMVMDMPWLVGPKDLLKRPRARVAEQRVIVKQLMDAAESQLIRSETSVSVS